MRVSAEPGRGIMLIQFRCGLLSGISITVLKDAYRPFPGAINPGKLILAVSVLPVDDFLAELEPF